MSWEALKSAVSAVITDNGDNEITGPILKALINNNLIPQLGAGKYQGLAVPTTNPITPETEVFYIAIQAGVYSNFGGVTVREGISVLKYVAGGTGWTKEELYYKQDILDLINSSVFSGFKSYLTLADLNAVSPIPSDNTPAKVTNDPTASNNGYYSVQGTAWVKDAEIYQKEIKLYTDISALKSDINLLEDDFVGLQIEGTARQRNGRMFYRIKNLINTTGGLIADDDSLVLLNNGLYAVAQQDTGAQKLPFDLSRINMHFKVLKGIPWQQSETGGEITVTSTSFASLGYMSINVSDTSNFVNNQLICYKADNGKYYSTVIESIAGNTLNLRTPIEATCTIGINVHNFYVNNAHPNPYGFYSIIDYALDELKTITKKVHEFSISDFEGITGNETLSTSAVNNILKSGGSLSSFLEVSTTANNEGITTIKPLNLKEGMYKIIGFIGVGSTVGDTESNLIQLGINEIEITTGNNLQVAEKSLQGFNCSNYFELDYYARNNTNQKIIIRNTKGVAGTFNISKLMVLKVEGFRNNLDTGKHAMLGDSWYAFGDIQDRIIERLPNAKIFNLGVPGHKADALLARFDTDVTPTKPDFVWIMCGTNDYFSTDALSEFEFSMNRLKQKIASINASAFVFDSSVGEIDNPTYTSNFLLSRQYAIQGTYHSQSGKAEYDSRIVRERFFVDVQLVNTTEKLIYMPPVITKKPFFITQSFFNLSSCDINIGFKTSIGVPSEGVTTYAANSLIQESSKIKSNAPSGSKFISISAARTVAGTVTLKGYIEIEYEQQ